MNLMWAIKGLLGIKSPSLALGTRCRGGALTARDGLGEAGGEGIMSKWDWTYVHEELAAAFSGEVAPGVFFEVSNDDVRIDLCDVRLRVPGLGSGYVHRVVSTCGLPDAGYVRIRLDGDIAPEIGWPGTTNLSFVVDREEMRGLCARIRGSHTLAATIGELSAKAGSLKRRIVDLLCYIGAEDDKWNIAAVRDFLDENCLEVNGE